MLFSFIIPVYKVERFLRTCVESILNQSFKDFEVLLVDDGSPDNSPVLCDELAKNDQRIKVIHKANGGASSARNAGLKEAMGEYIIFLDGDDYWSDNYALERIASRIEALSPDVLILGGRKYYTNNDRYAGSSLHLNVFEGSSVVEMEHLMRHAAFLACAWDKVVKRNVLQDNMLDFKEGQVGEDIEWCCKLLQLDLKYAVVTGDIHVYRQQNTSSVTANIKNKNLRDIKEIIEKYSKIAVDSDNKPLLNFLAQEYLLWIAITPYLTGDEGHEMKRQMGKYFWLLNNTWYPRVALLSKIQFLGYRATSYLITLALRLKQVSGRMQCI